MTQGKLATSIRAVTIHERIKVRRSALGLSMEQLGEKLGVKWQTVQQWEKDTAPKRARLPAVARVLGVREAWLLSGEPPEASGTGGSRVNRLEATLNDWRLQASPRSQAVIDQLTLLARKGDLSDDDWGLIEQLAARFRRRA